MPPNWQYKVVKSQRGMDGNWFHYPCEAFFLEVEEALNYAKEFANEQQGVPGTRILVLKRCKARGRNTIAEYRTMENLQ